MGICYTPGGHATITVLVYSGLRDDRSGLRGDQMGTRNDLMNAAEALGLVVADLAEAADIPHLRLANAAGLSRTTLKRRMAGDDNITARELIRLARVLGTTPSNVWDLAEERAKNT